ncbi:8222_t:CDS:2 [Cetraspora pellucida]|uniref:8222_t:CDS:1 n=1 Tax=Cetraspora pellucida TaxID=1433469 RepID=A0ACA9LIU4_9GLOM|nr:8222_t:CDS:2 [Cetraspora pellucida]
MSSSEEDTSISASTTDKGKKNIGGHPYGSVWEYFTKGEKIRKGRYKATCNLCGTLWHRGEPIELETHLANHCTKADSTIIRQFLTRILSNNSEKNESNKKRKRNIQGKLNSSFTICGIPWHIIENPFFIEALKETNLSYKPPTCQYLSGAELRLLIEKMNITGGGLKNYLKTRWTTASESIESILHLEIVLKKIIEDKILINDQINRIINHYTFFIHLKVLNFVLFPLKKSILLLESQNATLGDCYLSLAKTNATIKKLPIQKYSEFRQYCFNILNKRFEEFDDDLYILGYFLMPNFRKEEGLDKNELLLSNNLDYNKINTKTKDDLVLFLETSLDLNDEIFIDDLEKFPDNDDDENLLLNEILENIETDEVLENNENNSQILEEDEYD